MIRHYRSRSMRSYPRPATWFGTGLVRRHPPGTRGGRRQAEHRLPYMPDDPLSAFDMAAVRLRALGLTLRALPGEYLVNYRNAGDDTAIAATDLAEAVAVGATMAAAAATARAAETSREHRHPLSSAKRYRRRFIRRHNKWLRRRLLRRTQRV